MILYKKKKKKRPGSLAIDTLSTIYLFFYIFVSMNNIKDTNYFTKKITNCWCDDWLLVNEKVILIVGLDKTNKKLTTSIFCKNIIK